MNYHEVLSLLTEVKEVRAYAYTAKENWVIWKTGIKKKETPVACGVAVLCSVVPRAKPKARPDT